VLCRRPIGIAISLGSTRLQAVQVVAEHGFCIATGRAPRLIFKLVESQRLRVDSFFHPRLNCFPQFAQAAFEKMICAVNDYQLLGL
jgi:hypothetical protein